MNILVSACRKQAWSINHQRVALHDASLASDTFDEASLRKYLEIARKGNLENGQDDFVILCISVAVSPVREEGPKRNSRQFAVAKLVAASLLLIMPII